MSLLRFWRLELNCSDNTATFRNTSRLNWWFWRPIFQPRLGIEHWLIQSFNLTLLDRAQIASYRIIGNPYKTHLARTTQHTNSLASTHSTQPSEADLCCLLYLAPAHIYTPRRTRAFKGLLRPSRPAVPKLLLLISRRPCLLQPVGPWYQLICRHLLCLVLCA